MQKKADTTNPKVARTMLLLRNSLFTLMQVKPVEKITPTELCRTAKINRNTFYAHFKSVEELLTDIEDDIFDQVSRLINHLLKSESTVDLLEGVYQMIYDNKAVCTRIFTQKPRIRLLARVTNLARARTLAAWKEAGLNKPDEELEILYRFCVGCNASVIRSWVLTGMKESPRELALLVDTANSQGLSGFLEKK